MNDRRGLVLGVVLSLLGIFFLLRHRIPFSGPAPILLLLGTIFLTISALRAFRGPLLPGAVLLGLGAGFLLQGPLEAVMPRWASLIAGLGIGFLLVAALDSVARRERRPAPLFPGLVLVAIAVAAAITRRVDLPEAFARVSFLWPWLLVAAGVALVLGALRRSRAR